VWVSFGTRKAFCFLVYEIAQALGPEKAQALPRFHALTGCNMVSCFAGHGKIAWAVWTAVPELTHTLTFLSAAPDDIDEDAMHTIDRFIILPYNRTSTATQYVQGTSQRCKLFTKKSNVQLIPPTCAAWSRTFDEQYTKADIFGSGPGSCTNIAITDRLGLDQDQQRV